MTIRVPKDHLRAWLATAASAIEGLHGEAAILRARVVTLEAEIRRPYPWLVLLAVFVLGMGVGWCWL